MINNINGTRVTKISSIYETEPYGVSSQNLYLNQVIEIQTNLSPNQLHSSLLQIEKLLGRNSKGDLQPREIDIDILFYDEELINTEDLIVPHRDLHNRKFVLEPLVELNPDFIHPVFKKSVKELLSQVKDNLKVSKFE